MNSYMIADLILTLVSIGVRVDAIRAELDAKKASGASEQEVHDYLLKLVDDKLVEAQRAVE